MKWKNSGVYGVDTPPGSAVYRYFTVKECLPVAKVPLLMLPSLLAEKFDGVPSYSTIYLRTARGCSPARA
jgi:hypothetical protein